VGLNWVVGDWFSGLLEVAGIADLLPVVAVIFAGSWVFAVVAGIAGFLPVVAGVSVT